MASTGLEVPVFGFTSVAETLIQGARRLELNGAGSYVLGGTTPSLAELTSTMDHAVASHSSASVRVMIRPRGPPAPPVPDFIYSDAEFQEMRSAIVQFKESGLLRPDNGDGFVFGILEKTASTGRLSVDVRRNAELVQLAQPFQCVFHRAFDEVIDSLNSESAGSSCEKALAEVRQCGFHGILTSGGPGSAPNNVQTLKEVVVKSEGAPEIIVGGGVRSSNVGKLAKLLIREGNAGAHIWFHSSCLTAGDGGEVVNSDEVKALVQALAG